jgi:hypothetical protein
MDYAIHGKGQSGQKKEPAEVITLGGRNHEYELSNRIDTI